MLDMVKKPTYAHAVAEVSLCCDALVQIYVDRLDAERTLVVKELKKTLARLEKRVIETEADEKRKRERIQINKSECAKRCAKLDEAKERAIACLVDGETESIDRCIRHFREVTRGLDDSTTIAEVIWQSAEAILPLVEQLKTLLHIARAYPGEVVRRCERLKAKARLISGSK